MNRTMQRAIWIFVFALLILNPLPAFAGDETEKQTQPICFTPEMATTYAKEFAVSMTGKSDLMPSTPIKLRDRSGKAIGYIVDYHCPDGSPSGYIVFDNSDDSLISEYSFEYGSSSPYSHALSFSSRSEEVDNFEAVKISPFQYAAFNPISQLGIDSAGKSIDIPETYGLLRTDSWNDIFLGNVGDSRYSVITQNNIPEFIAVTSSQVEEQTQRYACGVSALLHCAIFYLPGQIPYNSFANEYRMLWTLSKTYTDHIENGITYGMTNYVDLGPALQQFLNSRGVIVGTDWKSFPTFSQYKTAIDSGNVAIYGCHINTPEGLKGHIMSVEGYAVLKNSSGKSFNTLLVADGWGANARYLNLNYGYSIAQGVFFSRI